MIVITVPIYLNLTIVPVQNPPSKAGGSKIKVQGPGIWVTCVKVGTTHFCVP